MDPFLKIYHNLGKIPRIVSANIIFTLKKDKIKSFKDLSAAGLSLYLPKEKIAGICSYREFEKLLNTDREENLCLIIFDPGKEFIDGKTAQINKKFKTWAVFEMEDFDDPDFFKKKKIQAEIKRMYMFLRRNYGNCEKFVFVNKDGTGQVYSLAMFFEVISKFKDKSEKIHKFILNEKNYEKLKTYTFWRSYPNRFLFLKLSEQLIKEIQGGG